MKTFILLFLVSVSSYAFDSSPLNYPISSKLLEEAMTKTYGNFDRDLFTSRSELAKVVCVPNQWIATDKLSYLIMSGTPAGARNP